MRFGNDIVRVGEGSAARVTPETVRSHRDEGDEPVEFWAVSWKGKRSDATKVDDFWDASRDAAQHRLPE